MDNLLRDKTRSKYNKTVNTAKDCNFLSKEIHLATNRTISASTLRRFFGLLPCKSNLSSYNLDTLAIFCGEKDFQNFILINSKNKSDKIDKQNANKSAINQLSQFTLNSISKRTLGGFEKTIPREDLNRELNRFIQSEFL
ncbi:MAG TPA: hypothetical protein DCG75_11520, partial [Bacteroidales bacterium]|nr:hypothetical protein [Bacteroidales bacterium]